MRKGNNVSKWTKPNGNRCFGFNERELFDRPWIIVSAALVACLIPFLEYQIYGSYHSLFPSATLLFFFFVWWALLPLKHNESIIDNVMHETMDDVATRDAKAIGRKVVRSKVHYDTKGTYGVITGRYFLVLLDNDEVWEYPFIHQNSKDNNAEYYECVINYSISKNDTHIRAINPKRLNRFVNSFKLSEKSKMWAIIALILIIGGVAFEIVFMILENLKWWYILVFCAYLAFYSLLKWCSTIVPGKFMGLLASIVSFPLVVIYILFRIAHPFITIAGSYFFLFLFAFLLPLLTLIVFGWLGVWKLNSETITFLVISIGSIICAHYYGISKWIIRHTPLRDWGNHRYESYQQELCFYLIHPSNIIFLLYLLYFAFLTVSGYMQIQCKDYVISAEYDGAIMKAFLVFIAFTNMRMKANNAEMDVKFLFQKNFQMFEHDK